MDDWAICATDKGEVEWLLKATRAADPDAWRDRARDVLVWRNQEALESLAREAVVENESVPLMLIVAGLLSEKGSDEGVRLVRRVQAAHPGDFWACFGLAELLGPADADALGFYRAAVSLRPEATAARVNLAIAMATQQRLPEAIECMQVAVSLDPHSHVSQFNLAIWLLQEQRFAECAVSANAAVRERPEDALSHGVLASALMRLNRHAEAADSFRTAIRLLPDGHERKAQFERALRKCEDVLAAPSPPR
jgi:cytochrome c-type biogenesis protein CcmH/NrfG